MLFKDDLRQLADLKQQISQTGDTTLQHIATMSLRCEVISLNDGEQRINDRRPALRLW